LEGKQIALKSVQNFKSQKVFRSKPHRSL